MIIFYGGTKWMLVCLGADKKSGMGQRQKRCTKISKFLIYIFSIINGVKYGVCLVVKIGYMLCTINYVPLLRFYNILNRYHIGVAYTIKPIQFLLPDLQIHP